MSFDKRVLVAAEMAERVLELVKDVRTDRDVCSPGWELYQRLSGKARDVKVLGHGHYGVALLLPDGNVLKVALSEQDAYPMYAQWAQLNPGDHIPEIYYTCRVHSNFFVAAMPKYESLDYDSLEFIQFEERKYSAGSTICSAFEKVRDAVFKLGRRDLHAGNVMWDQRRGQVVITDPVAELTQHDCYTSEAKAKGLRTVRLLGEQVDWIKEAEQAECRRRLELHFDWRMQAEAIALKPGQHPHVGHLHGPQAVLQIPKDWEMVPTHIWDFAEVEKRCIDRFGTAMQQQEVAMRKHGLAAKDFDKLRPDLQARVKLHAKRWPNVFAR